MRLSSRGILTSLTGAVLAAGLLVPSQASALTSVEGAVVGDQGFYWEFPSESWIFYHRIVNIDERAMIQFPSAGNTPSKLDFGRTLAGSTQATDLYNVQANQVGRGGGVIVNVWDQLNIGAWVSEYQPDLGPAVARGAAATGWTTFQGPIDDIGGLGLDPLNTALDAGRKIDLFLGYKIDSIGLETGLKLNWGSNKNAFQFDDSLGPVNIDEDSNPTDPNALATSDARDVAESVYSISDFGLGIGAGYTGLEDLRVDLGFGLNFYGVTWEPNAVNDYVDAGGTKIDLNLRAHYKIFDSLTAGIFFKFATRNWSLEPLRQRDGGNLVDIDLATRADTTSPRYGGTLPNPSLAAPPDGDPAISSSNETSPVNGIIASESLGEWQITAIAKYEPSSRATLYAAVGFGQNNANQRVEVGSDWHVEQSANITAIPFINLGFTGRVFDWLDLFVGASKRWSDYNQSNDALDERIPDNGDAQGPPGTAPTPGNEDNTNSNRRQQTSTATRDVSHTQLSVGARVHYAGFQMVAYMNENVVLAGPFAIFGDTDEFSGADTPNIFVSVIYDWDYDEDKNGGNGTIRWSPHKAEGASDDRGGDSGAGDAPADEGGGEEEETFYDS